MVTGKADLEDEEVRRDCVAELGRLQDRGGDDSGWAAWARKWGESIRESLNDRDDHHQDGDPWN